MVVGTIENTEDKSKLLAILLVMWVRRCNIFHISRWSMSRALFKATGRRHQVSVCTVYPWRLP